MTTNEYIKNDLLPPFDKKLWQKSYYNHIIRDENDYIKICEYIENNLLKWEQDKFYYLYGSGLFVNPRI